MRYRPAVLVLVALGSTLASGALAQWTNNGAAVCTNYADQLSPRLVSDGAGGAILTWTDDRDGSDIFVQRMSAAGIPLWPADGVALTASADIKDAPAIASDGAGGAIVTWHDYRNGSADIYAQRVDASGVPQWTTGGVAVCTNGADQLDPKLVSDGAGGAIIAWQDYRNGVASDIFARRVNSSGIAQGVSGGFAVATAAGNQDHLAMIPDGAGGAIVAWEDGRAGSTDIYAQRVDGFVSPQWTVNGVALCAAAQDQGRPAIVSDGGAGAIVAWWDTRSGDGDIYAQRVNAGVAVWTANGVALCTDPDEQGSPAFRATPAIATDGAGGAIVTWGDARAVNGGIYARRVNAAGVAQWTANGVAVATTGPTGSPTIASDGAGGGIVGWLVTYDAGMDFFAQQVNSAGVPQWAADGIPLTLPENDRNELQMIADGAGSALVAWSDSRNGLPDIFASIINGNTPAGTNVMVTPRDATTGGSPVTVIFSDAGSGSTTLVTSPSGPALPGNFTLGDGKYYHLSTTASLNGNITVLINYNESALTVPEADVRLLHYDATIPRWVDITTFLDTGLNQVWGVTTSLSPFVIGAGQVAGIDSAPVPAGFALRQNLPNPFRATTVISFDVPNSGADVRITIYDVAGKQVRSFAARPFAPGVNRVSWDGRDDHGKAAEPGIYFYRMDASAYRETRRMVRVR